MKNLKNYLLEQMQVKESSSDSKTFTWNFEGLEDHKETFEELEQLTKDNHINCKFNDNSLSITVTKDDFNVLQTFIATINKYAETCNNSLSRKTYESYAQKYKSFTKVTDELVNFITPETPEEKQEKQEKQEEE